MSIDNVDVMNNLKSRENLEMMINLELHKFNILASRYPLSSKEYSDFIDTQGIFYFNLLMINLSRRDYIEDVLDEITFYRKYSNKSSKKCSKEFENTLYRDFKNAKKLAKEYQYLLKNNSYQRSSFE